LAQKSVVVEIFGVVIHKVRVTSGLIIHHQLAKPKGRSMFFAQEVTWYNISYAGTQVI